MQLVQQPIPWNMQWMPYATKFVTYCMSITIATQSTVYCIVVHIMLPCSIGQVGVGIDAPANQIAGCSQKQLLSGGGFHHPGHYKTEGQLGYDCIVGGLHVYCRWDVKVSIKCHDLVSASVADTYVRTYANVWLHEATISIFPKAYWTYSNQQFTDIGTI